MNADGMESSTMACECPSGFAGDRCQFIDIDDCNPNPCKNGGSCEAADEEPYTCFCKSGFTGKDCSIRRQVCSHATPCLNGGTCTIRITLSGNLSECLCASGYTGNRCADRVQSTASTKSGLTGSTAPPGKSTTLAVSGSSPSAGDDCSSSNEAQSCQNGGSCRQNRCMCPDGYTGKRCEVVLSSCVSSPCGANETCRDLSNNILLQHTCVCKDGYTGRPCRRRSDIRTTALYDFCSLHKPCDNGGTCHLSFNGVYQCHCPRGFIGHSCEVDANAVVQAQSGSKESRVPAWAWVIFVTGLIIAIAVVTTAVLYYRKKHNYNVSKQSSGVPSAAYHTNGSGGDTVAFDNPIADYDTDSARVIISPFSDEHSS